MNSPRLILFFSILLTVIATSTFAKGRSNLASAPVTDGCVKDPVTGVVEPAYVKEGIRLIQYGVGDGEPAKRPGRLYFAEDSTTYYFAFEQSVEVNDNSYGYNAIGWNSKRGHSLEDLLRGESMQVQHLGCDDEVVLDVVLDYASLHPRYAGIHTDYVEVIEGDPAMITDNRSSLMWNLYSANPMFPERDYTSPARIPTNTYDSGTTSDPNAPWIYETLWEWQVNKAAWGSCQVNQPAVHILNVANSPPKQVKEDQFVTSLLFRATAVPESGTALSNGDTVTYTLQYKNTGTVALTHVVITDMIDSNLTLIETTSENCSLAGTQVITCETTNLAAGQEISIDITATVEFIDTEYNATIFNLGRLTAMEIADGVDTNVTEHPCADQDANGVCDHLTAN